jgi:DNA-binding MarR family transcriptional regulator
MGIDRGSATHEGFRMIPDRMLLDQRLEAIDVRLWGILLFIARGRPECDPSDAILAARLGVSDRTVRRALDRLEDCRFVSRRRSGDARFITLRPEGDGEMPAEFGLRAVV